METNNSENVNANGGSRSLHAVVRTSGYLEPKISLDSMSKKVACFDGFELVRGFQPYTDEQAALKEAHEWFKTRTIHVPQVVRPMIRKMKMS